MYLIQHKKKQAILCLKSKKEGDDLQWVLSADALGLSSPKRNAYSAQKLIDMTDARVVVSTTMLIHMYIIKFALKLYL